MRQHFHRPAFRNLMEAGRGPVGLAMHIQRLENRGRALRRQLAGIIGQLAQIVHLLPAQQQVRIHPAFDVLDSAHAHQAAADFDDIQAVPVLDFGDAGRFRRQVLA